MADSVIYRPRSAGLALGTVALPLLSAITVLLGVVAVLRLEPIAGLSIFVVCQVLALGPLVALARIVLGLFALEVGTHGLAIIGRLGSGTVRLRWPDLSAVGLVDCRGSLQLAVRPVDPYHRPYPLLSWTADGALLLGGLDNWSAPRDEVLGRLRRCAGSRWVDRLDQPAVPAEWSTPTVVGSDNVDRSFSARRT